MINEANASSSACRLWRFRQVETSTPPKSDARIVMWATPGVKVFDDLAAFKSFEIDVVNHFARDRQHHRDEDGSDEIRSTFADHVAAKPGARVRTKPMSNTNAVAQTFP